MDIDLVKCVEAAKTATWIAGLKVVQLARSGVEERLKESVDTGGRDIVTVADEASQEIIRRQLAQAFPDFDFLGEEGSDGLDKIESDRPTWVVDPLDGTQNFARGGYEHVCVMVGLCVGGKPVVGVVHNPWTSETYVGTDGAESYVTTFSARTSLADVRRSLAVSRRAEVKQAVVTLGLTSKLPYRHAAHTVFGKALDEAKGVRIVGCAGMAMMQVARGSLEAYLAPRLAVWDALAPSVILRGAGARVTDAVGDPWTARSTSVIATNGSEAIHAWGVRTVGEALAGVAVK